MPNKMVQMKLAKESALLHVQEAIFWLEAKPMEFVAYQRLQKAIAIEALERSGLEPEKKALIYEMWPPLRPDPGIEQLRKNMTFLVTDKEAQEAMRKFCAGMMEEDV